MPSVSDLHDRVYNSDRDYQPPRPHVRHTHRVNEPWVSMIPTVKDQGDSAAAHAARNSGPSRQWPAGARRSHAGRTGKIDEALKTASEG